MLCPFCQSGLAEYGRDYKKCNVCGFEMGGARGTVPGRVPTIASHSAPSPSEVEEPKAKPAPITANARKVNKAGLPLRRRRYRSAAKRHIRDRLIENPGLTNLQLCRFLDDDDIDPPPELMTQQRSWQAALLDGKTKARLQSLISKIRHDLEQDGLL